MKNFPVSNMSETAEIEIPELYPKVASATTQNKCASIPEGQCKFTLTASPKLTKVVKVTFPDSRVTSSPKKLLDNLFA